MKCKNHYCYYELDGRCTVRGETIIDENGRCAICSNIKPTKERVNEIKKMIREEVEKENEYISRMRPPIKFE